MMRLIKNNKLDAVHKRNDVKIFFSRELNADGLWYVVPHAFAAKLTSESKGFFSLMDTKIGCTMDDLVEFAVEEMVAAGNLNRDKVRVVLCDIGTGSELNVNDNQVTWL